MNDNDLIICIAPKMLLFGFTIKEFIVIIIAFLFALVEIILLQKFFFTIIMIILCLNFFRPFLYEENLFGIIKKIWRYYVWQPQCFDS